MNTPYRNSAPGPDTDHLQVQMKRQGDAFLYTFANGLQIKTETLQTSNPRRILPLGSPQKTLMNLMAAEPSLTAGRTVFEPFAGSGALGFMALKKGASHVTFLDLNERAIQFQDENARLNGLTRKEYAPAHGSIEHWVHDGKFDLLIANPPFVPTPEGIPGVLHSDGGPDGNRLLHTLFARMDEFLASRGRGLLYLLQIEAKGIPLLKSLSESILKGRPVQMAPVQTEAIRMELFRDVYLDLFPEHRQEIGDWHQDLIVRLGPDLSLRHYFAYIAPKANSPSICTTNLTWIEKFGSHLILNAPARDIAEARISENLL